MTFSGKNASTETITKIAEAPKAGAAERFDLQGRRVEGMTGLMIENGKIRLVR